MHVTIQPKYHTIKSEQKCTNVKLKDKWLNNTKIIHKNMIQKQFIIRLLIICMISFQKLINLTSICPHHQIVMPQRGNERRHGIMETRSNQPLWRLLTNKHGGVLYRGVFETDIHWQWIGMRSASKSFLHKTMCVQHFNLESSDYYKMQIYACSRKQKT